MRYSAIFLLCSLLVTSSTVFAQSGITKKADRYMELFKFDKALQAYEKAAKKDPSNYHAISSIAKIHRITGNMPEAEFWYANVIKNSGVQPLDHFYYAQALQYNGSYQIAKEQYNAYADKAPDDARGKSLALGVDLLPDLKKDSIKFNIQNININSAGSDFSPAWYDSSLVFVSGRGKGKKDVWSDGAFYNLYLSELSDTGETSPVLLEGKVNKFLHEGPATFSPDRKTMFFTRNNYVNRVKEDKSEDNIIKLTVFSAKLIDGKWDDIKELPFCSQEYSVGHPAMSADGKKLYFSSDMPGGYGNFDLYVSEWDSTGWKTPVNLGAKVNTLGNEYFPTIHEDGTLYFSSDSYEGLGGLDMYRATDLGGGWWSVENVGYPLNSKADDLGIIWDKDKKTGYFSSNRSGGYGDDDIYKFDSKGLLIRGLVYDKLTGDPLDSSRVYLVESGDTLMSKLTNSDGRFNFRVEPGKTYNFVGTKLPYNPNSIAVNTAGMTANNAEVRIPLDKGELIFVGTVINEKTGQLIADAIIPINNNTTGEVDTLASDANGKFRYPMQYNMDYKVLANKFGLFLSAPLSINTTNATPGIIEDTLRMYGLGEGSIVELKNIYYDLDKYNIRPDAAEELERVIDLLKKYPEMVIQLRSHTDCRATDMYNMNLSARRAESASNYIINHGAMIENLTASAFGETQLVNQCGDDVCNDSSVCGEQLHQLNRRTEFKVIKQPNGMQVKGSVQ